METEPAEQLLPRVVATQPQALCFSEPEPVAAPVPAAPAPICSVLVALVSARSFGVFLKT